MAGLGEGGRGGGLEYCNLYCMSCHSLLGLDVLMLAREVGQVRVVWQEASPCLFLRRY